MLWVKEVEDKSIEVKPYIEAEKGSHTERINEVLSASCKNIEDATEVKPYIEAEKGSHREKQIRHLKAIREMMRQYNNGNYSEIKPENHHL